MWCHEFSCKRHQFQRNFFSNNIDYMHCKDFIRKLKLPTVVDTAFERKITPKTSSFKNIFCLKFRNVLSLWRISRTVVFYTICFSWLVTFICLGHFKVYSIFIKKKIIFSGNNKSTFYFRILPSHFDTTSRLRLKNNKSLRAYVARFYST